ncbi:tRNA 2-thiouridine(34) synthase MnmA [Gabonibacter massiliensis]|uniref:tRNA 2-thiouridine(34) synthase MnmA n=1 Tax=Gabonibacter massiliensis TaxID=1720195 RepID=UPI00073EB52B|nr:tRNA 2-thiouridine(34) synthase MnmA [Gabonibacter massiliensis]
MRKIVVGLSGGVDSFVTALLLRRQGYEVIGVNMDLWPANGQVHNRDLEEFCKQIEIPLYRIEGRERFGRDVVLPFLQGYLAGITPNPCAVCNRFVKWELLKEFADRQGIQHIATGHYVRIGKENGHYYIYKGVDSNKDQSYFLWGVNEMILSRALTPLGNYRKEEVKEIARMNGFPLLAKQRESSGICFLQGTDYRTFICQHTGSSFGSSTGEIWDEQGNVLGSHHGVLNYTIGQKRDIPLKDGNSQYVSRIEAGSNRIIVSDKSALFRKRIEIESVHLIDPEEMNAADIEVKVRGLGLNPSGYVQVEKLPGNRLMLYLSHPAWAVAPGQPVALYRGERLVGGGIVRKTIIDGDES